jgi:hypothetical protein
MLLVLTMLGAAGSACAQDDRIQALYASLENRMHAEYRAMLAQIAAEEVWPAVGEEEAARKQERIAKAQQAIKQFVYNKAALTSQCAAEAVAVHSPAAPAVPAGQNLMLRTCMETKFELLRRFANTSSYAGRFFPERVAPCEQRARLADQEKLLPPYAFLDLDQPKLYDFELYNKCLMTVPEP